jgi:hypothetical protein
MSTLEEYVAAAAEARRRAIEAYQAQLRAQWEHARAAALEQAQQLLTQAIGATHLEALAPTWTGTPTTDSNATKVWAEVPWRGHLVQITVFGLHHIVIEERAQYSRDWTVPVVSTNHERAWETILLFLADLPGRHGCGHLRAADEDLADACFDCRPSL